jgi:hypothetical protein
MSGAGMKRLLLVPLSIAFAGCTTTTAVPVVKEAQKCAPDASLLAACEEPAAVRHGITFGELIEISSRDRETLRQCALRQKSLAEAIAGCNGAIDAYNSDIREFNASHAAKQ